MKKLFKEGKRDFRAARAGTELLVLLLCINFSNYSQVPINGFSSIENFPASAGYNRMIISDVNYDSHADILLYSSLFNKLEIIERDSDSHFTKKKRMWTPNTFSGIVPVKNNETGSVQYAYISRGDRKAGLFDLSNSGKFNSIAKITFDSYPGNISTADINYSGSPEVLISGSAFRGLSILAFENDEWKESKIENNSSYCEAILADVSGDGYKDIAAFNLFNNELEIFYNDVSGNFIKVRSLDVNSGIDNLSAADINNDYNTDLIYCSGKAINILWGDFQSSYDSISILSTKYFPHRYSIADFNNDNNFDIAYIDSSEGLLSIFFGKGNNNFYPETPYFRKDGIVDLQALAIGKDSNLFLLNRNGEINIISTVSSVPEDLSIVPSLIPGAVSSFDINNDHITDYCYIEKLSQTINFIINNRNHISNKYFSIPVSASHNQIIIDDDHPVKKGFYCYTNGSKMIEIINCDFAGYDYNVEQLYIPGIIKDVKIKTIENLAHIFVLYEEYGWLKLNEYEYHDFRYTVREYPEIDKNSIAPILVVDKQPGIYYWKAGEDSIRQYSAKIRSGDLVRIPAGKISRKDASGVTSIMQTYGVPEKRLIISLFISDSGLFSSVTGDSKFTVSNSIINKNSININYGIEPHFEQAGDNLYNLVTYSAETNRFEMITLNRELTSLSITELFEAEGVAGFVRQKIDNEHEFLLFTQPSEGKISLKRLEY